MTFTDEERARFDELVERDLKPYTLVVKDNLFELTTIAQDITPTTIQHIVMATRPLKKRFFFAAAPAWTLLTGHVDRFNALPHATITSRDSARVFAKLADTWTTTWEHGQLEIASFDEIPWRDWIEDRDRQRIEAARVSAGPRIEPEQSTFANGVYTFTTWVIASATLLRRTMTVSEAGEFQRSDEIVAEPLPIPLGRYWKVVDGRMVPTG
jgi:hypothetical protein